MEDQTQQGQVTETPTENSVSDTTPAAENAQVNTDQPAAPIETSTETTAPVENSTQADTTANNSTQTPAVQDVPCDCKCIHKLGYVEVELADGTKQQMTVQQAQDELTKYDNIKKALGLEGGARVI
ncbi:MAG TPA: hypothetical protein VNW29_03340 [Candidatus Sulfotelmatobacter sp.]|jgi:hypothetical protein|nr:hypothetical protein [Candidatus Sulfotelmatobacter sp.]